MRAYFGIKIYEDYRNKDRILGICGQLKSAGIDVLNLSRDVEHWGESPVVDAELLDIRYREIRVADFVVIDATDRCVSLGIEMGYAKAMGKPIFLISDMTELLDPILESNATHSFQYKKIKDIRGLVNTHWLE